MADRAEKTHQVADGLREQILAGEWAPGDKLPSEKNLETQFDVSKTTVRRAIDVLKIEGLLVSRQGSGVFVHDPEPTFRLVIVWHREQAEHESGRVAEPPISFAVGPEQGKVRQKSDFREGRASERIAELLGVSVNHLVVERAFKWSVGNKPILRSTSYLPIDLARETPVLNPNTEDIQVGQLALLGEVVTPVGLSVRGRSPTPHEAAELDVARGISMLVITRRLLVGADREQAIAAAVEIVAPDDRVFLEIELGPQ